MSMTEPKLLIEPPAVRRDRPLFAYVAAACGSRLGDAAWLVALGWTAVHLLSPAAAGLVVAIGTLPQAALMLVGGLAADRFDTRRVLVLGELGRAVVLVIGALAWTSDLPRAAVLVAVAASLGAIAGITTPSSATMLKQLVRTDDLPVPGGWLQVGGRLGQLSGAPLGAFVVVHSGLTSAMLINAATFTILALVIARVSPRFALPRSAESPTAALRDGFALLRRPGTVRSLALGVSSLNVFVAPIFVLGLPLRVSSAGWSPGWLGAAEAVFAVAAIGGSLAAIRWRPDRMAHAGFMTLIVQSVGLALTGVAWQPTLILGCALIGATAGIASVWISAAMLAAIPPSHLGRISSVTTLGDLLLIPIATPAFGFLAAHATLPVATLACGLGMGTLCLALGTRPAIRTLTLSAPEPSTTSPVVAPA